MDLFSTYCYFIYAIHPGCAHFIYRNTELICFKSLAVSACADIKMKFTTCVDCDT
jgi:hypothetical protein